MKLSGENVLRLGQKEIRTSFKFRPRNGSYSRPRPSI